MYCIVLHCIVALLYIALYCIVLYCITLHCIVLKGKGLMEVQSKQFLPVMSLVKIVQPVRVVGQTGLDTSYSNFTCFSISFSLALRTLS